MSVSLSEWPTEAEAAALIGASAKTIQRYAAAGKIEIRKRKREGKKPENVCNPRDVEKLMPAAHVMPAHAATSVNETALTPRTRPSADGVTDFLAFIRSITTAIETQRQIVQMPKLWLSMDEAVEYSGLARKDLRALCREGKLVARKSRGWRIRRVSLEAFEA